MKVLVIGSGAREHALIWRLSKDPDVRKVFCAPGNPGTAAFGKNVNLSVDDLGGLVNFATEEGIDLTVVGPEYPLTLGVADQFRQAGLRVFGPTREAARIEGSKSFAKEVMQAAGVPTARYSCVATREQASLEIKNTGFPVVLKADGLAAGKGVFICNSEMEAEEALDTLINKLQVERIVIEEFLQGVEASYIVLASGEKVLPLPASHDYKRIFDNDQGPNTGGMGTVSPTPHLTGEQEQLVLNKVIKPVLAELKRRNIHYCGFLYAGLMVQPDGQIKVLEFNARMGDPECQVIMRRLKGNFFQALYILSDTFESPPVPELASDSRAAVCVVLASRGYPQSSSKGDIITGVEQALALDEVEIFHAGTAVDQLGRLITAGGRVLSVTALADSISEARAKAYRAADFIQFEGRQLRRDIGLQ
ncbi:MAG: phosphoribosylamine--glycine ligase [Candidatus Dadabacteria bacterium]|nr:MAG: phosphoribosylamine--glycine ligase [Candidatus Dadabacteria bacterium]